MKLKTKQHVGSISDTTPLVLMDQDFYTRTYVESMINQIAHIGGGKLFAKVRTASGYLFFVDIMLLESTDEPAIWDMMVAAAWRSAGGSVALSGPR